MSNFLPAGVPRTARIDLATQITQRDPSSPLQQDERQLLNRLFGEPAALPQAFWAALIDRVITDAPSQIPFLQLQGASQFTPTSSFIAAQQTTTSTSYTDLATVGPQITNLSKGSYLVLFGATQFTDVSGDGAVMSIQVNADVATDADWALNNDTNGVSVARAVSKTLSLTSNTITAKYKRRAGAGTVTFEKRWLTVIRFGSA